MAVTEKTGFLNSARTATRKFLEHDFSGGDERPRTRLPGGLDANRGVRGCARVDPDPLPYRPLSARVNMRATLSFRFCPVPGRGHGYLPRPFPGQAAKRPTTKFGGPRNSKAARVATETGLGFEEGITS